MRTLVKMAGGGYMCAIISDETCSLKATPTLPNLCGWLISVIKRWWVRHDIHLRDDVCHGKMHCLAVSSIMAQKIGKPLYQLYHDKQTFSVDQVWQKFIL